MAVTALPYVGQGTAAAFRLLYLPAFLLSVLPLTWLKDEKRALTEMRVDDSMTTLLILRHKGERDGKVYAA